MFSPFFFYKIFKRFSGWHETLLRELPVISSLLISWAAFSSIQNQHLSFKAPSPACCQMRSIDREVLLWGTNVVFECIRNCKWWKMTPKKKNIPNKNSRNSQPRSVTALNKTADSKGNKRCFQSDCKGRISACGTLRQCYLPAPGSRAQGWVGESSSSAKPGRSWN